jgi:hypothetical protein
LRASRSVPFQQRLVTWIPYVWLLVFFLAPFLIVAKVSLSQPNLAIPPYLPVFNSFGDIPEKARELSFANYVWLTQDALYIRAYLSSIWIAAVSTLLTLLIGYPIAYGMARAPRELRPSPAHAGDPAVLDVVPDPRLCLDRHPQAGGACSTRHSSGQASSTPASDHQHDTVSSSA